MKMLIVSDIHANWMALQAITESADIVVCLGDLVDYGPCPAECIAWAREHADQIVRGNHDHAVGFDADPQCSAAYREMALATKDLHRRILGESDKAYLRDNPLELSFEFGGARFYAVHASPLDPLHRYLPNPLMEDNLSEEIKKVDADVILMGHTHLPSVIHVLGKTVINPGSVGQPKQGDPRSSFAVWEDGEARLMKAEYPVEETIRQLEALSLDRVIITRLSEILRTGRK